MTIIETAKNKIVNDILKKISKSENIPEKKLCFLVSKGHVVIPKNKNRSLSKPCGIGRGLTTKVNVNIGTSPDSSNIKNEIKKLKISLKFGADTIMDLSVGRDLAGTRKRLLDMCPVPLGTVPVYEAAVKAGNNPGDMKESDMINALKAQAKDGVDFFTIHAGVTKRSVNVLKKSRRLIDIVSRGGAIIYGWMERNARENPYYSRFDEVLDIAREFDITLSLGDGMRPGAVADATDKPQIEELEILGELQKRALKRGVQTMIEGPGHVPLNQIPRNIRLQKSICNGAPFYVLGPLVTDIAPGYDHITSAIGGAIAAYEGADFLCYVTPAEHLRLPTLEDVRDGLIASKIAAHAADVAKGHSGAIERDIKISRARNKRDWKRQFELALDPYKAAEYRRSSKPSHNDACTMCGGFCPIKISQKAGKK